MTFLRLNLFSKLNSIRLCDREFESININKLNPKFQNLNQIFSQFM